MSRRPAPLSRLSRLSRRSWLLATATLALAACGRKAARSQAVPAGATVLALGDSLTSGVGATPDTAYPAELARRSGWKVVNGGVSGDTSAQALERLPALLAEHRPALVIVSIGGNDFLRRMDVEALKTNIRAMVGQSQAAGAQVLLVAIPGVQWLRAATTGGLDDHALYAELAAELRVPLLADAWSSVLGDARLRSDNVHANAAGYQRFAELLVEGMRKQGLLGG